MTQNKTKAEGRFELRFHCAGSLRKRNRADRAEARHTFKGTMTFSSQDRADLRELLRTKLNGKVDGFQDTDLNAMLKKGLSTENKLAATSWQELSEVALLPRVLVQALLEAYNASALDEPGSTAQQLAMGNWSSDGTSNCFNMGDLIIAANQIADGQEGSSRFCGVSKGWRPTRKRWRVRIHWLGKVI